MFSSRSSTGDCAAGVQTESILNLFLYSGVLWESVGLGAVDTLAPKDLLLIREIFRLNWCLFEKYFDSRKWGVLVRV